MASLATGTGGGAGITERRWRWILAATMVPALAACESGPPAVSLEEAKQITATFEGESFVPPPRTINDITAILDQQKLADPKAAEEARAAARRPQPPGLSGVDLAEFYWERGLAARKIGDAKRQIADLKEAERLSREADPETRMKILWDLANAEIFAGNFTDAIRHREESLAAIPDNRRGAFIGRGAVLVLGYAASGNLEAADRLLAEVEQTLAEATFWKSWERWGSSWTSQVERAKARILDVRGRYAEAESLYRSALRGREEDLRINPDTKYGAFVHELIRTNLAKNLRRQGRLVEAEIEARRALTDTLGRVGRYSSDTARMLKPLASVIAAQGRHAEAEKLARAVIDIYRKIGATEDSVQLAGARRQLAKTLLNQGRWQAALAQFDAIKKGLATDPETFQRKFANNLVWALALLGAGRAAEAREIAKAALERNQQKVGKKHYNTAKARGILAMALAELGERKEALAAFTEAIPILLSRSRQADDENTTITAKEHRLGLILESYVGLLADVRGTVLEREAGIDAAAEAFRMADVARSRSVQRALAASSARAAARDPALADLVRREQDAQKQISALFGLLANALSEPTDQQDPKAVHSLRVRIDRLRSARGALAKEIEKRFPVYAELVAPKPASVAQTRPFIRPGEALIATYVGEDRTFVWAVPQAGEVAFASAPLGRERISAVVRDLRRALAPSARTLGEIPEFDIALAHKLYRSLLEPVREGWREANSLLVVAHRALGQLPFSLLVTAPAKLAPERAPLFANYREVPWLARSHAVTNLPSVASLATLRALPPGAPGRRPFAGFGDPYFSESQAAEAVTRKPAGTAALASRGALAVRGLPIRLRSLPEMEGVDSADLAKLPRLPDTADEVRGIAVALNADLTRDVFTGAQANEHVAKTMDLSGRRVIAFATHGLVPGDLNGLRQPALALTSPKVAGVTGDGLLTMGEILALKLDADWVVLSACNTAAAGGAGAEAVSGLGRAFFYAGARALLVSNWPVETTSARALTTDLFRRQAADPDLTRAEALRAAMLALIDGPGHVDQASGKAVFSYAHPIFWAPFTLIGDGGGQSATS